MIRDTQHTIWVSKENKLAIRSVQARYSAEMNIEFAINKIIEEWRMYEQMNNLKTVICAIALGSDFTADQDYICYAQIKNQGMKSGKGLVLIDNKGEQRLICSSYFKDKK